MPPAPAFSFALSSCGLTCYPRASLLGKFLRSSQSSSFRVYSNHGFGTRRTHQYPRAIVENQFHSVQAILPRNVPPSKFRESLFQSSYESRLYVSGKMQVQTNRPIFAARSAKKIAKLVRERRMACSNHLGDEQAGQNAVLLGKMAANCHPRAFFAA